MKKTPLFAFGLVVAAIAALGLVVLSSASEANALRIYGNPHHFMVRQAVFVVAGALVAALAAAFDYRRWRSAGVLAVLFYVCTLALLVLVFHFKPINGSYRWIPVGPVNMQPSEFAKIAVVVSLAVWLDKAGWRVELFKRGALSSAMIMGGLILPVLFEPDFGSVLVMSAAGVLVMFLSGVRFTHILVLGTCGGSLVLFKLFNNANRMARLAAFFGGSAAAGGGVADEASKRAAYQAEQALVDIKNGGITGVGLGESMQKHFYLPEAHTDFIFAVGGEELGLFFTLGVLLLFAAFFALSVYIACKATDRLGRNIALGMAFLVFFQAVFNLGVVCNALPTKGMALPFFSYGGTNMLCSFFAVGTILSVGVHSLRDRKREMIRRAVMK